MNANLIERMNRAMQRIGGAVAITNLPDEVKEIVTNCPDYETRVKMLEMIADQMGKQQPARPRGYEGRKAIDMKKIKLTSKEAHKLAKILNIDIDDDGMTFYATDEDKTEIWSFDTKSERDRFIAK